MNDVRWFAPNRYAALVVGELRSRGLTVATEGREPARLALSMSGTTAVEAWSFARRHQCPLVLYLWDLPPKATGSGTFDPVFSLGSHLIRIPRLTNGYGRRRGHYSRLRYIAVRSREVWVPSQMSRELIRRRFGVEPCQVPYCYDSARFRPAALTQSRPPTLLTVGRLRAHKNHAATLRAASHLGEGVQVHLIGRGPELARLQQLARSLGVRCRIDTEIDDAGVAEAYRQARVAVCPSRFEGFGLGPLEAIASGTPAAVSDIPPHREFVGETARLFPLDDDRALVDAVTRALEDGPPDATAISALTIGAAANRFLGRLQSLLH